ncbi:site-specific integrase [Aliivibrio salmonicida]|uniref:site-specific integrase n=1 Tax=Aliivibrio salmonicida TaxID=40269 RepID=UPI00406D408D
MPYSNHHIFKERQRTIVVIDNETTLPSIFLTIYGLNVLRNKSLGTQENNSFSLKFFYAYYFKKYKRTFDYDFYRRRYNISHFINDLDGFFPYMLGKQHLNNEPDISNVKFIHTEISVNAKVTYVSHLHAVGRFLKYLNERYMNLRYQDLTPVEAHKIQISNQYILKDKIKSFNSINISNDNPISRYKSISELQCVQLNNMLIPSTPEFIDIDTNEIYGAVINPQNPFHLGIQQYRNYLIHRLMFNYGLRIGEVLLLSTNSVGPTQPDSRGVFYYILIIKNLPDDVNDPRRKPPSIKTKESYRQIELTENDYSLFSIYIEKYRDPLFLEKNIDDHGVLFIKVTGQLTPLSYDAVRTFYKKKIDPCFIAFHPYYRSDKKRIFDSMVALSPHVGRHTWAYMTLEYIYNDLLKEEINLSKDYGLTSRMQGLLDAAANQLSVLGGWSTSSKMPMQYGKRFIEMIANRSNRARNKQLDQQTFISDIKNNSNKNNLLDEGYDEFI